MIDHLTMRVRDFPSSKAFYVAALAPLGYAVCMELEVPNMGKVCGLGVDGKPEFWLATATKERPTPVGQHLAFRARTRAEVDAFHAAALKAGAHDDGRPGVRE